MLDAGVEVGPGHGRLRSGDVLWCVARAVPIPTPRLVPWPTLAEVRLLAESIMEEHWVS